MRLKTLVPALIFIITPFTLFGISSGADGIRINDIIVMSDSESDATEILGLRGGYVHPYLSVRGEYTDNLYNVGIDEKDNFLTVISPGIWFASPAVSEVPVTISPHNTASGGVRFGVQEKESFDRFQAYLLGGWDFELYSENSDLDATNYHFEGMLQFNLRGGLSLRVLDRLTQDQDRFDVNSFTEQDVNLTPGGISLSDPSNVRRYKNNLGNATLNWDMSEKFTARIDYTNFYLDYDGSLNDWLNRTDNVAKAYLYYNYSPKTSFFTEYKFVDADYNDVDDRDNQQNFVYGGIDWKATAKTSLMAKAGYQNKSYDADELGSKDSFVFNLLGKYRFTEKTSLGLTLFKGLEESDSTLADGMDTFLVRLRYEQKIYNRFVGVVDFTYINDDYEQTIPSHREDDRYYVRPALQYVFLDWLMAEVAYTYDKRDSSQELYDYDTNIFMFSLNSAL